MLAGTGLELAGEIQLVGAPRGQMLANSSANRAANSHVRKRPGVLSPAVHLAFTRRARDPQGQRVAMRRKALLAGRRIRHAAKPDVGGRGVLRLR